MIGVARTKEDVADLINVALGSLTKDGFELPPSPRLMRPGTFSKEHSRVVRQPAHDVSGCVRVNLWSFQYLRLDERPLLAA